MANYRVGVVIPVYLTNFIAQTVDYITATTDKEQCVFCIVNDGIPAVEAYLETLTLPENFHVVNLSENRCFSGSNNAGFNFLLDKYPDLEYIGSLNDDTIPQPNWLSSMVQTLDEHPEVAAVTPNIMALNPYTGEAFYSSSIFIYGTGCSMNCCIPYVATDTYTNLFCGFCFVCRSIPFKEVGFLDEEYQNGAEDMDLSLSFITKGYKLMVSGGAAVVHFGGKSRSGRINGAAEISHSIDHLFQKWGTDLMKYNSY